MRNAEPVVRIDTEHGYVETHPSFGAVTVSHVSARPNVHCFGSRASHGRYILIDIKTAEPQRDCGHDSVFTKKSVLRLRMTHDQFTRIVADPNNGSGVPVTFEFVNGASVPEYDGEQPLFDSQKESVDASVEQAKKTLDGLVAEVRAAMEKGHMTRKLYESISLPLEHLRRTWSSTAPFLAETAKAQLEAHSNAATRRARVGLPLQARGDRSCCDIRRGRCYSRSR